ncbi:PsbP-related protein [Acetivibrio cellulolyticus]|uniref:PsbP-related protein n=1 Tax=Acetivibrio cellulolyticus TaxID=35830 RepID=UPI0001E2F628|nr:PsbP-related protein [Acetivibrio cellulolyticus]
MYIIYVKNYKKKIMYLSLIILLWIAMFMAASMLIGQTFAYNLTINDYLTFSCPTKYTIEDIFINQNIQANTIEANYNISQNIAQKFSTYKSMEGQFSFDYPTAFELKEQDFNSAEILYHIGFRDKNRPIHGFVQVWNMPYSLDEFLAKSKSTSTQNYLNFNSQSVTVDNSPAIFWNYSILTNDNINYRGLEVFWKKDNKMYRISYFVPGNLWSDKEYETFWSIVKSFKTF